MQIHPRHLLPGLCASALTIGVSFFAPTLPGLFLGIGLGLVLFVLIWTALRRQNGLLPDLSNAFVVARTRGKSGRLTLNPGIWSILIFVVAIAVATLNCAIVPNVLASPFRAPQTVIRGLIGPENLRVLQGPFAQHVLVNDYGIIIDAVEDPSVADIDFVWLQPRDMHRLAEQYGSADTLFKTPVVVLSNHETAQGLFDLSAANTHDLSLAFIRNHALSLPDPVTTDGGYFAMALVWQKALATECQNVDSTSSTPEDCAALVTAQVFANSTPRSPSSLGLASQMARATSQHDTAVYLHESIYADQRFDAQTANGKKLLKILASAEFAPVMTDGFGDMENTSTPIALPEYSQLQVVIDKIAQIRAQ